jgi:GrpB-like predicted nucleotidyltransferase (UPF0157 family)
MIREKNKLNFVQYNDDFPKLYKEEEKRLKQLGNFEIHHIGSSAIPKMPGKGVIDILILVDNQKNKTELMKKLSLLGYKQSKTLERGRSFFWRFSRVQEYGIHIMLKSNPKARHQILFKDFIINNPKEFKRYLKLKKENFIKSNADWTKYKNLKNDYFKDILERLK